MPELWEVRGDRLRLNFHAGQLRAWDSKARFVGIIAGSQSGKTVFLAAWLWREIQLRGPGDYAFVGPNFTLMELKALPAFRRFFEDTLRLGTYAASPVRKFTFSEGGCRRVFGRVPAEPTVVYFGHAENPNSLESATFKAVALDEAGQHEFKRESWEALQRRLAIHQGRACIGTTPYFVGGWLKSEIIDRAGKPGSDVEVVNFPSTANPAFPREEAERARRTLPEWKYNLFYLGLLTRPPGLIYHDFDEAADLVPRFALPDAWPRYLGLDFGAVNTAGVFYAAEAGRDGTPTGTLYAYREYHAGDRTCAEHCKALRAGEPALPTCYGGAPRTEDGWREAFRAGGLPVREPPVKEVEIGIDRVIAAHKAHRVKVFDDLHGYLNQKRSYSRVVDDRGETTEEIEDKARYHYMDAERYLLSWLNRPGPGAWDPAGSQAARSDVSRAPGGVWQGAGADDEGQDPAW